MRHLNLDTVEITHDASDPEGYRAGRARLGRLLGAEQAGASLYELPPGQGNCPYHYEVARRGVAAGARRPPDRAPSRRRGRARARARSPCSRPGPTAPTSSRTAARRPSAWSCSRSDHTPAVSVYPDSDKVGTFTGDPAANVMVPRDADVDYWHGEA